MQWSVSLRDLVTRMSKQAFIRIVGPGPSGGFVVEFRKHTGERLTFVVPANAGNDVLAYFHERMPYGIVVRDLDDRVSAANDGASSKRL